MQKYSNTTESPKLSIATKTEVDVYLEVDLPYYCRTSDTYFKVISLEKALRVTNNNCFSIIITNPTYSHIQREIASGIAITESEFDKAALAVITDVEEIAESKRYTDENVQIDEMIYDQR
jgi:hypothetical protein